KKVALFPTSAGQKTIPSQEMEASVRVRERRGRRDIFDSFFDDPFFGRNVAHRIASDPVEIDVLPLPLDGQPPDFAGAVGKFNISARVDRKESKTNEAITLKVTLAGEGNIKTLPQPAIDFPTVFEVYDPKVTQKVDRANNRVSGSKTYEYVVIPRRAGAYDIPSFRFTYFDPRQKQYKTVATKPITLNIEQGKQMAASVGSGFSKEEVELLGEDIRYIEKAAGSFTSINRAFYNSTAFWLVLLAPLALLLSSIYYRTHQERLSTNVAYARNRKAQKVVQKQLKDAKQAMDSGQIAQFYSESANALTRFVGNKLNVDDAALMTDELAVRLQEKGASDAVVAEFQKLLSECDFRRFAMPDAPEKAMAEFYDKVRNNLADLEKSL
ncbi:MAG: BatD family protein, partial [bacterium]